MASYVPVFIELFCQGQKATDNKVLLRLNTEDAGEGTKLAQDFGVTSLPTFLLLTPQGTVAGTIRGYAVSDTKRAESAADIPTADEAGLPGFHMTLWSGLWVPKGTPPEIITKLNAAAVETLNDLSVRKQLENIGLQMPPRDQLSPQALGDWQKAEIAKWWPMLKAANVKVE